MTRSLHILATVSVHFLTGLLFVTGTLHGLLAGASLVLDQTSGGPKDWLLASLWIGTGSLSGLWIVMILRARLLLEELSTEISTRPGSPNARNEAER